MKFNHLPADADVMWQVCPLTTFVGVITNVTPWRKNPRASMVYMLVLGAGGDGGSSASFGGGGGGSGGQTSLLIPAMLLPDFLYVSTFANTYGYLMGVFSHARATDLAGWRAACVAYAEIGGTANANAAGLGGPVATASNMPRGFGGVVTALAGQAGTNGASSGAGTANTYPTTGLLATGGAGGGAANAAGGGITASAPRIGIPGGAATLDGGNGINFLFGALLPSGGAGGGGSNGGAGGRGGNGGFGCGGGGAGHNGVAGLGGPGLIVIAQW